MARIRTLIFHGCVASYRVDLFNRLHRELDLHTVLFNRGVYYQPELDNDALRAQLIGSYEYLLRGIHFRQRDFRIGMGRIVDRFRPQVVVTPEFSYNTLYMILHRKLRAKENFGHVICTEENVHMLKSRGMIRRALRKVCCNAAEAMVVYSEEARKAFPATWMPQEQIFASGNNQDESVFCDKLNSARPLVDGCIRKHHLTGKSVVLFAGRLAEAKNLPRLLEAFARVAKRNSQAVLALVGGGPEKTTLKRRVARLGIADRVIFTGHQNGPQLYVWYLVSSMFVLPSQWEPYGAVVNESLMSGLPVLCSSQAGARVLIRGTGSGSLFDPLDVKRLAQLIEERLVRARPAEVAGRCQRDTLMPDSFEETVASFIKAVECAAERAGRRSFVTPSQWLRKPKRDKSWTTESSV